MFLTFLDELRLAGIPASLKEHLVLLEALDAEVIDRTPEDFYYLARATYVKDEGLLDRFDEEYALFDRVAEQAQARGWTRAARVARRKSTVRLHLAYRTLREILRLRPRAALRWLRYLVNPH